jgi:putative hydrolase of the HAD superfamily
MDFSGIIFDMHGTLVYEDPDVPSQWRLMAQQLGVDHGTFAELFNRDIMPLMAGKMSAYRRYKNLLENLGLDAGPAQVRSVEAMELTLRRQAAKLYPGTFDVLKILRQEKVRLGLLTNCTPVWADILSHLGLIHLFHAVNLSCDHGLAKPDRRFFGSILEKLGTLPEETAYVGDGGDQELEMATEMGMTSIYIDQMPKMLRHGEPGPFVHRIAGIKDLLPLFHP